MQSRPYLPYPFFCSIKSVSSSAQALSHSFSMAAHPSPLSGLQTPANPTPRHATASDWPKLRNSCHRCSSSKLKCSQEKPTCSRCAKRGHTCEYVAAKQGGRKPGALSHNNNNNKPHGNNASKSAKSANNNAYSPSQTQWFAPSSSNPSTDFMHSLGKVHYSPTANVSASSDILQDLFSPMDQTLASTPTEPGTAFDDCFNSPVSFSTDLSDINIFGTADFLSAATDSNSACTNSLADTFPVFEDAVSEFLAQSPPSSSLPNLTTPSKEEHSYKIRATESPCSCLVQALSFMKHLFPSSSNACTTWTTQGLDKVTAIPSIQAVIARNEATIEAVSTMLKCACSQDGYLLSIMSLIMFKVLGWYAAVARKTPSLHSPPASRSPIDPAFHNSTVIGSYCLDGADSDRMAAQLVLSELHRVRLLISKLSSKLKGQAAAAKKRKGEVETSESMDLGNELTLPLSAVMYDQLDNDLRNRLRTLSCEMLDRLRRL